MSHPQKGKEMVTKKKLKKGGKEKPVFICDYCQKQCSRLSNLKRHVTVHTGQKDFHCNLCDYSCSEKGTLTAHIRRHLKERPFKCPEPNCGADFSKSGDLKRHQLVHNKKDKKLKCSVCSYKTNRKYSLTAHMKNIHSESRPFECPHENCEYSAKLKTNLDVHSKIHSQVKDEICPHPNCGFKSKWSRSLKLHIKTHSNEEKRYKCHFCDFSSHHHGNLVVHIRRHTRETPFGCQLCPFKSKTKSHLKWHMKNH